MTRATDQPLTLVAAAPGSGKTVLLTQWAASRQIAPAWVTVGASDNEPSRFWSLVAAAFQFAGLEPAAAGELDVPSVAIDEHVSLVDPYLRAAAAGDTTVFLVIDDAHLLTHPTILYGLDALLRGSRPHVRLILAARTDPLLPLHRYRLAGQMSELRAHDLAMTDDEAHALLLAHHVTLSQREFNVLAARTEGWAAGLRLSAMNMEGAERPEEFVSEFALDQGSVGEYLMYEILGRQPERVRTLLIETSFLPDLGAELAEAVTGMPDAGEMLAELSRTNAFVVPLDRTSGRFRYHQLLREMLRYLLRREPESRRHELYERASRWHYEQGEYGAALRVAVDAHDWVRAAEMLVHGGYAQAFVNHTDLRFLRPTDLTEPGRLEPPASPEAVHELALARGALHAAAVNPHAAKHELDTASGAYTGKLDRDVALTFALVELVIALTQHRVHDLEPLAAAVTALSEDDESLLPLRAAVELACGGAQFWVGSYDPTEELLLDALAHAGQAGDVALELRCLAQLALFHAYWGRFSTSQADEERARALMGAQPGLVGPTALGLALCIRSLYQADFDAAFASLRAAEATIAEEVDADVRAAVPMLRGLLLASVGHVGAAQVALAPRADVVGTLLEDFRVTMLAAIETALGRPNAALKLLRELPANPTSPGMAALAGARAYLALGELRKAEDSLRPLLAAADTFAPRSSIVEALVVQAQISNAGHDEEHAVESLIRACELADGEIVHPFVLVADDFREVVSRHSSLAALWPDIRLGSATVDVSAETVHLPGQRLPEPLTDRERTVLRWLSTTMSTKEIADEMCLSINTVKTHIAAIYRKLAAARRRDAVLRARTLELL